MKVPSGDTALSGRVELSTILLELYCSRNNLAASKTFLQPLFSIFEGSALNILLQYYYGLFCQYMKYKYFILVLSFLLKTTQII